MQFALTWSPDGTRLVVSSTSGQTPTGHSPITVFDPATGEVKTTLLSADRGDRDAARSTPAFSPDGRRIACTVQDRAGKEVVKLWDADSGKELLALPTPKRTGRSTLDPKLLAFTPEGRLVQFWLRRTDTTLGPAALKVANQISILTWDGTPRPEPKK